MKKRMIGLLVGLALLITAFPIPAKADHGPKPTTKVQFANKADEKFYATILYEKPHSTMYSAYDGTEQSKELPPDDERKLLDGWKAFVDYKDKDGYYFLQLVWNGAVEDAYWWYCAPDTYKILLYFPEYDYYAVSDVLTKHEMNTVVKVDIGKVLADKNGTFDVKDISNSPAARAGYMLALIGRFIFTLLAELLLALLFKLRERMELVVIAGANLATQLLLNIILEVTYRDVGLGYGFMAIYILMEFLIFIAEMIIYLIFINKVSEKKHSWIKIASYSFVANFVSFVGGFIITFFANII